MTISREWFITYIVRTSLEEFQLSVTPSLIVVCIDIFITMEAAMQNIKPITSVEEFDYLVRLALTPFKHIVWSRRFDGSPATTIRLLHMANALSSE